MCFDWRDIVWNFSCFDWMLSKNLRGFNRCNPFQLTLIKVKMAEACQMTSSTLLCVRTHCRNFFSIKDFTFAFHFFIKSISRISVLKSFFIYPLINRKCSLRPPAHKPGILSFTGFINKYCELNSCCAKSSNNFLSFIFVPRDTKRQRPYVSFLHWMLVVWQTFRNHPTHLTLSWLDASCTSLRCSNQLNSHPSDSQGLFWRTFLINKTFSQGFVELYSYRANVTL